MLLRIKEILTMRIGPGEDPAKVLRRRQLAAAALLLAVARADQQLQAAEEAALEDALRRTFGLGGEEMQELLGLAQAEVDASSSDFAFTRLVNDSFSETEKSDLVLEMWRVAFADGDLSKYEEHLIRKIAVLIYVPHSEFIRTKLLASR